MLSYVRKVDSYYFSTIWCILVRLPIPPRRSLIQHLPLDSAVGRDPQRDKQPRKNNWRTEGIEPYHGQTRETRN